MFAAMDWQSLIVAADMEGRSLGELLRARLAVPWITHLVHDSIPFRNQFRESGWFLVRALSEPIIDLQNTGNVKFCLFGYLESKRLLGLKTKVEACISDIETGWYWAYPSDLMAFVLKAAESDTPVVTGMSIERLIHNERNTAHAICSKPIAELTEDEKENVGRMAQIALTLRASWSC